MSEQPDSLAEEYRIRSNAEKLTLLIGAISIYALALGFGVYEWLDGVLVYLGKSWINQLIVTFAIACLGFWIYANRRAKDLEVVLQTREDLEEEFKNYRNQIKKVFEALDGSVLQTDRNLRVIWANGNAIQQSENPIGAPLYDLIYGKNETPATDNFILKAIETGLKAEEIKYYSSGIAGSEETYFNFTAVPTKSVTGDITGVFTISTNISEKMKGEESRSRLASIIESSDDAIFVVALDGNIHSWNKSAEKIFGYSASEVVGQAITILDHVINFETLNKIKLLENLDSVTDRIQHIDIVPLITKDKELFISLTVYPFVDDTGKALGFSAIARDVTSSIQAQRALKESESRFRQLADTIQDAFWLIDLETKQLLFTSPAYEKIWGVAPQNNAFNIEQWASIVHAEDKDRFIAAMQNIIENDGMIEEFRIIRPDGSTSWIRERGFPVYNELGRVYRVAGIAQDITGNKKAEQAVKESETRFKELFQNMSSGVTVYEFNPKVNDFIIRDFNKSGENIEKTKKKDLLGKPLKKILQDKENYPLFDTVLDVYSSSKPSSYLFTLYKNGEPSAWRQNYIYKLPSGEVVSIFDDVTEKIKQDEALRESEERYRTFVQNFKGIAFRWTPDGSVIFIHGSIEEISGFSSSEFVTGDNNWENIIFADDIDKYATHKSKISRIPHYEVEFEYRIRRKDGTIRWVNEVFQNICDDSEKIVYIQATLYDVTFRKEAEQELVNSRTRLRNLALHLDSVREEERKHIAFEIHDELGYALTAVKLDLAWLSKKIDLSKDNLEVRTKEMSDLIELTIQKVRSISSQLRPSILDHFGLVAAIDWQSKEFQRRTSIRTRVSINPKDVQIEEKLATPIFRIFQEALTNISRYAKASRVDVNLEKNEEYITLRVADNGIGIPENKIHDQNSFGLLGIREKAKSMGGKAMINRLNEGGTEVVLNVNLKNKLEDNDD